MNEVEELRPVATTTQFIVIKLGEEQYGIDIKYIDNRSEEHTSELQSHLT